MDEEKRPKRRKDKYNPYTISKQDDHYNLEFRDGEGIQQYLKIDTELFDAFDDFELEDLSILNEYDNHIEHFDLSNESISQRAFDEPLSVDERTFNSIQIKVLHESIAKLPEKQKRRLMLYYFDGMTYEQIAKLEGCTIMPIKRSIDKAIEKLKSILKKGG